MGKFEFNQSNNTDILLQNNISILGKSKKQLFQLDDEINPSFNSNIENTNKLFDYLNSLIKKNNFSLNILMKKLGKFNLNELIILWDSKKLDKKIYSILEKADFNKIIDELTDPNILLSFNVESDSFYNRLSEIPNTFLDEIHNKILSGKTSIDILRIFKNGIPKGRCPNPKIEKFIESINKREIIESREQIIKKIKESLNGNKALTQQLLEKLEESATKDTCTFNLIQIINNFNNNEIVKYNNKGKKGEKKINFISNDETLSFSQDILIHNGKKINYEVEYLSYNYNPNNLSNFQNLSSLKNKNAKAMLIASMLTAPNIATIIKNKKAGKSNKEIISTLIQENKELKIALTKFNKEQSETNTYKKESENIIKSEDFYETHSAMMYGDSYRLPLENGEYIEGLTKEEAEITKNPEAAKNLVEFKSILDGLKMTKIWEYRTEIFKAILGPGFSANNFDYLNKNEIKLFLNSIITSITPKLIKDGNINIPSPNSKLEEYINIIDSMTYLKQDNIITGRSYIDAIFIKKFIIKGEGKFRFAKFEKII